MAACLNLAGYSKGCDRSIGGIKKVFLCEMNGLDITGATIVTGEVTIISMYSEFTGYTYDFLKDNSNFTQPIVGDGVMTSVHWEPTVTLVFRKMSNALRNEIYELAGGDLVAIVQDFNDNYWFIGSQRGLQLMASAGSSSGNKLEELNGETLILKGIEPIPSYTIDISSGSTVDARILALFGF